MSTGEVSERFVDEKLAAHWRVDETEESFLRLLRHLEETTNFKPYFEEALQKAIPRVSQGRNNQGLIVLDIGSGVSWTSAIMANDRHVGHVYAVEPSRERLKHAEFVMRHYKVLQEKVTLQRGTFTDFSTPRHADLVVLCASFHHCYNEYTDNLFSKIKAVLASEGLILLANEHYVDHWFTLHRWVSYFKHWSKRRELFYSLSNLRAPYPHDGEHWRTRKELEAIFRRNGLRSRIFVHDGDLCKEDVSFHKKMGYHYYYALLEKM